MSHGFLFAINIWMLSIPHTFSTLTRSDLRSSQKIVRTLAIFVFFIGSIFLLSQFINFAIIFTGYFLWQQYHYSKQNYGIARWGNTDQKTSFNDQLFYLIIPIITLLGLFSKGPQIFFNYLIQNPIPYSLQIKHALILNFILTLAYIGFRPKSWKNATQHTVLFSVSYLFIDDFYKGWLCLNIFHNLQYLRFMQVFEKNIKFLILPLVLTALVFVLETKTYMLLSMMLALNFTHYTLDSMIWKRKPRI